MKKLIGLLVGLFLVFMTVGIANALPANYYVEQYSGGVLVGTDYSGNSVYGQTMWEGSGYEWGFCFWDLVTSGCMYEGTDSIMNKTLDASGAYSTVTEWNTMRASVTIFSEDVDLDMPFIDVIASPWGSVDTWSMVLDLSDTIEDNFYTYVYDFTAVEVAGWKENGAGYIDIDALDVFNYPNDFGITDVTIELNAPVPEPATMLLFGLGILGLAGVSRKKLNK